MLLSFGVSFAHRLWARSGELEPAGGNAVIAQPLQNSVGVTGLIHIPTAEMHPVGTLLVGGGNVPLRMMPQGERSEELHHYYVGFMMFSSVETTLNFTLLRLHGARHYNNQDRNGSVRLRLWSEGRRWLPSVVVGSNSLFSDRGSSWWENYYAVATRSVPFGPESTLSLTAGYYFPWGRYGRYFGRPFGGVAWTPQLLPWPYERMLALSLVGEYDSRQFNYGLRVTLLSHLFGTFAWTDGQEWTWQVGYKVQL